MNQKKEARQESAFDFIKPSLIGLTKLIAQKDKEIKQSEEERKKFSKLVNIKRGLS